MTKMDIIRARHSVREYTNEPISQEQLDALQTDIDACIAASGLNIQLVQNNPEVFDLVARFGLIHGATTSIAFLATDKTTDEAIGYWGQRLVLLAQELGLNTCWVAMCARKKSKATRREGEKVRLVIAIGHGVTAGNERKTKSFADLTTIECATIPAWFNTAMEAAQLAPTAVNNQNFHVTLKADGETVDITAQVRGMNIIDLGIVKRNFEVAANEAIEGTGAVWRWA